MKKILQIILICLILVGTIIISTIGFNVGIKYSANKQINVYIGTNFNVEDIKNIAKETLGNKKTILVQKVELYEDMAQITVKDASEEEINNFKNKINEKYKIENEKEFFVVTNNSNVRLRNLIKPYIFPVGLVSVLVIIFTMFVFKKLNIWKVLYEMIFSIIGSQAIFASIYAITRLPINRLTSVLAVVVFIISITLPIIKLNKMKQELIENKDNIK